MNITLNIPANAEAALRDALGPDLSTAALAALLIEGYRTGKLSTGDIAEVLGFETRHQAQHWLAERNVSINYSLAELDADRATLDRMLGPVDR